MSTMRVLIVDDDGDFAKLLGRMVESWGFIALTASSGKEAVALVREKSADVVIIDYLMPGMNGIETLREIRKIDRNMPAIMCTSFPDRRSIVGTEELGIIAYIPKVSVCTDPEFSLKSALGMAAKKAGEGI